jgi:hypothetical protein
VTHQNSVDQEQEPSALVLVSKVLFASIAVVLAMVFLVTLPRDARIPLVIALAIGLVFGLSVVLALRPRAHERRSPFVRSTRFRGGAWRQLRETSAQLEDRRSTLDEGSSVTDRQILGSLIASVAVMSLWLFLLAWLAPPEFGAGLAILGLGGLFLVRLAAFHPRGIWRPATSLSGLSARRRQPTVYVSPEGRERLRLAATIARIGRVHGDADRPVTASRHHARATRAHRLQVHPDAAQVRAPLAQTARRGDTPLEGRGPTQAS